MSHKFNVGDQVVVREANRAIVVRERVDLPAIIVTQLDYRDDKRIRYDIEFADGVWQMAYESELELYCLTVSDQQEVNELFYQILLL